MAKFGDCMQGRHAQSDGTGCVGKRQKWYFGPKRVGRKTVEDIIFLDEYWECDCKCHRKGKK